MTAPARHGETGSRERAWMLLGGASEVAPEHMPDVEHYVDAIAAALDAAEARGRAEAAAKIEALAAEYRASGSATLRRVAGDLEARALAAELSVPGSQEPQP